MAELARPSVVAPRSSRLIYRRLSSADVEPFHTLCLDSHLKRYLLDGVDLPREWVVEAVTLSDRLFNSDGVGLWLVERDGVCIGFCGFRVFEELGPEPQLLYAFAGVHVGRGYATEAASAMLVQTRRLGWFRVLAAVDQPNVASMRVLEKSGFVCCGRVPGHFGHTVLFERFEHTAPERIAASVGSRWSARVAQTWDGHAITHDEDAVRVDLELGDIDLSVRIDAPFHDDPSPESDDLWHHEVVELMLLGLDDTYLELELSPHGRYLVLFLHGVRRVVHRGVTLDYRATIEGSRWRGVARVPIGWLPSATRALNAFAMHGVTPHRRFLAWKPTGGISPDFHRLTAYGSFDECLESDVLEQ